MSARQIPLDLAALPNQSRDDLVVTASNADAVALIDRWPDWPARIVVLAGPPGSGKSHLAAIWRHRTRAEVLSHSALGAAKSGHVAWLVENADLPDLDEAGLFHLINAAAQQGGHILLTARSFPGAWRIGLPDLISRLRTAAVVEILAPDDMLLEAVVAKLFADRQVDVDLAVVRYLARRIERSLSTAMSVVERLDRAALEQKTRITRALAAQIVSDLDRGQPELDF